MKVRRKSLTIIGPLFNNIRTQSMYVYTVRCHTRTQWLTLRTRLYRSLSVQGMLGTGPSIKTYISPPVNWELRVCPLRDTPTRHSLWVLTSPLSVCWRCCPRVSPVPLSHSLWCATAPSPGRCPLSPSCRTAAQ